MTETKPFTLPAVTAMTSGRAVDIEYRASIDFSDADALPAMLVAANAVQPGRIVALRLRWYWSPVETTRGPARMPHWVFDRYHSRILAQRRTAKTVATEASWGTPLTRTVESIQDCMRLIEPYVTLHAPSDEPVLTWMHRDR